MLLIVLAHLEIALPEFPLLAFPDTRSFCSLVEK